MTGVEVRAWSGVVLIGALLGEACARAQPPPAAAPVEPGEDLAALKAAKAADRCVDAVVARRQTDGDIVEVGLRGEPQRLRVIDLGDPMGQRLGATG